MRFFMLYLLAISIQVKAQITKDSLRNKLVNECCIEIKKKDFSKIDKSNYQSELSVMILPVFIKNAEAIESTFGAKFTDRAAMRKMGEEIGFKLMLDCPEYMKKMMEINSKEKPSEGFVYDREEVAVIPEPKANVVYDMPPLPNAEPQAIEKGTLISVNPSDITTITIKTAAGKIEKLYWMDYFENADDVMANQSKYLGKKIQYSVIEQQVFNAAKKNYKTIKVISMIELQ